MHFCFDQNDSFAISRAFNDDKFQKNDGQLKLNVFLVKNTQNEQNENLDLVVT